MAIQCVHEFLHCVQVHCVNAVAFATDRACERKRGHMHGHTPPSPPRLNRSGPNVDPHIKRQRCFHSISYIGAADVSNLFVEHSKKCLNTQSERL